MASGYVCQDCSRLPPPPPMFTIGPPPNILSIEVHCPLKSISSQLIEKSRSKSPSPSSSSSSISIVLGIIIAFLITSSTIVLIKKRLIKRKRRQKSKFDDAIRVSSSSVKFNRHLQHNNTNNTNNHHHHHHHQQNWTKMLPLLSDSCSSDKTSSTPPNEYPCPNTIMEPLLTRDLHHEYEQIKCDDSLSGSLHYYCLIYCRQCANYHPTTSSSSSSSSLCPRSNGIRSCYLPVTANPVCQHQCSCYHRSYHQRNDNRIFELQPMLTTTTTIDNQNEEPDNRLHLQFSEEIPSR